MSERQPTTAPDNDRLSDSSLLNQAIEFAAAADAYAKTSQWHSWMTLHFLIGRSMELVLKAFAVHAGASEKQLRIDLGHDISAALTFSKGHGFIVPGGLSDQEEKSIGLLGHWYKQKLLEYPLVQGYLVPHSRVIREILDRFIAGVFIAIWGEPRYRYDKNKKDNHGLSINPHAHYAELPQPKSADDE